MTTDERCNVYLEYKKQVSIIEDLEKEIKKANEAGDISYQSSLSSTDTEAAYTAGDKAGWFLADDLVDKKKEAELKLNDCYEKLLKNPFDLSEYYSCCAYGITDIKRVEVTLLDDTKLRGIIYPYVYDNPQEMVLEIENGDSFYLGEGWEVKSVTFLNKE